MGIGNPFKSLEKKIKRSIEDLGNSTKRGVTSVGNAAKSGVQRAGREAEDHFNDIAHTAERELKQTFEKLEDDLEDAAEEAFEVAKEQATIAARAAMREVSKGALNKLVDGLQVAMPSSVDLQLGPVGLSIGDITKRVDTLQKWASNPPSAKNDLRKIIEEVAPTSVTVNLSFSLAFLVVQSDSLEFAVSTTYETVDFLDKMDAILAHWGISI